ncbi:MAG: single-stranded DNA-binding protein [Clostridia bacterium]|nr:single-stranded DNA-binding protein [Clostridia bacterium]
MNRVILLGRLARNPELRYTQAAEPMAVCRFTVASDRPLAKDGDIKADFINCTAFGKRAENINKYFAKGSRIAVQGRLQVSNYTDQQGNKKYSTDVIVDDVEFIDTKAEREAAVNGGVAQVPAAQSAPATSYGFSIDNDSEDEDLPF